jgi:hypothetical protein
MSYLHPPAEVEDMEPQTSGNWDEIHIRKANEDALRMAYLDDLIQNKSKCRICGNRLTDGSMERHPGVCGLRACWRKAAAMEAEHRKEQ